MWYIWLIAAGIFFVIEIATVGFLIFWLGIGALAAMIVSFFIDSIFIQTLVFVVVSTILIILTKPLVSKFDKSDKVKTNAYSVIGKKGIVIVPVNTTQGTGQVKVSGDIWSAKSDTDDIIPIDTEVEIVQIDGVKLIVTPKMKEKVQSK